ncbi:amino acid permease [Candidatus Palibaumannia cicadellinicola]|uniref:Lysine-specific permease n=1 Tax=Baumannia cicadellinicola subsp. Homalodisca coagulata TaxID=374463 RepID=Q1LT78_BAUCH|nr:amino acid permease [Candidatus Baumannia cicadellinicola]ABF13811.1 lysine-specific permease [Baumannia cicadellinicola str. Hc (Homalodisca coagulata)]MCJ7462123.1 amino acid permease [Candidatus Baumannia cicadellinicola]MCJ7462702.1 amino acid permease [Candidatus Baumannia cicadellinicola]
MLEQKIDQHTNVLRRELKTRHLTMITIGGSIGTGLFVASGASISQAGPGGALLLYIVIGLMVYFLMTSLGELTAYMPVSGSFVTYGNLYVEEGFGFALGWNYWYNWAVTIAVDLVAAQIAMSYWFPTTPGWVWSILFISIIFLLNVISVKGFGEAEYCFSLIKVATVFMFIVVGILMILGVLYGGAPTYWYNWQVGDAPFVGGFTAIINVAMIVGFSFQGTEIIGIAIGESVNPSANIPRTMRQVFWRILFFYVLSIFIIGFLIPYDSAALLQEDINKITISPFTLVFRNAGQFSVATIMNIVILTAVLSAGNSGMYASTRMLYTLAREGQAPNIFARLSKRGIPCNALYMTTIMAALCFLSAIYSNQKVYLWLLNISGTTGFIAWLGIAISHYRFRRGLKKQGYSLNSLPYRAGLFPFGPIFAFSLCIVIILGQNYQNFLAESLNWNSIITTYIGIILFLLIWFSYKWYHGSSLVRYDQMIFKKNLTKNTY